MPGNIESSLGPCERETETDLTTLISGREAIEGHLAALLAVINVAPLPSLRVCAAQRTEADLLLLLESAADALFEYACIRLRATTS